VQETSDVVGGLTGKQNQAHHLCRRHWRPLVIKPGMDQDLLGPEKTSTFYSFFILTTINDPFLEVSNIFTQRKQRRDMTAKKQQWVHLQQVQHREIEIRI